jgi:hypothetical protein
MGAFPLHAFTTGLPFPAKVGVVVGQDLVVRPQLLDLQGKDEPAAPDEDAAVTGTSPRP